MADKNPAQSVADIMLRILANLPLLTGLAPGAIGVIQNAIALFRSIRENPNATVADIDAAIAKIEAQSAQIQAMK